MNLLELLSFYQDLVISRGRKYAHDVMVRMGLSISVLKGVEACFNDNGSPIDTSGSITEYSFESREE